MMSKLQEKSKNPYQSFRCSTRVSDQNGRAHPVNYKSQQNLSQEDVIETHQKLHAPYKVDQQSDLQFGLLLHMKRQFRRQNPISVVSFTIQNSVPTKLTLYHPATSTYNSVYTQSHHDGDRRYGSSNRSLI